MAVLASWTNNLKIIPLQARFKQNLNNLHINIYLQILQNTTSMREKKKSCIKPFVASWELQEVWKIALSDAT